MRGSTLRNCQALGRGAALYINLATAVLNVTDCALQNCVTTGGVGAGLFAANGATALRNVSFVACHALGADDGAGGGVFVEYGQVLAVGCAFKCTRLGAPYALPTTMSRSPSPSKSPSAIDVDRSDCVPIVDHGQGGPTPLVPGSGLLASS